MDGSLARSGAGDVDAAVEAAASSLAGGAWAGLGLDQRCALLNRAADILVPSKHTYTYPPHLCKLAHVCVS